MTEFQRIPPGQMVRSFLLIAGAVIAIYLALVLSAAAFARGFWPDAWTWLTTPELNQERFRAEAASRIAPGLFWSSAAVATAVAAVAGWSVARLAAFAGTAHAVFLAVAEFILMVQTVTNAPGEVRWMPLTLMATLPMAVLAGARFAGPPQDVELDSP